MTVASGQFVYEYTTNGYGDEFNFYLPGNRNVLAPSSILIEEIMYALSAESNRGMEQAGYTKLRGLGGIRNSRHNSVSFGDKPHWSGLYPKWVNESAETSGLFSPSATGGHLDGTLAVTMGNAPDYQPAHISSRWLYDMKLQFRDVVAYISRSSNASSQEIFQDWLKSKGYTDRWQQSGIFFQEGVDLLESNQWQFEEEPPHWAGGYNLDTIDSDEYQFMFKQEPVFSGTWLSSRHLNEVRIQPIPYLGGSSGSVLVTNGHDKSSLVSSPLKPKYMRTNGTLAFGYDDKIEIVGDVFVTGMTVMISGNGTITYYEDVVTGVAPVWGDIPDSGVFDAPTLDAGYYRVGIGMEYARTGVGLTSGLFPWGTGMGDAFTCAVWPRTKAATTEWEAPNEYSYLGENEAIFVGNSGDNAFVVTDYVWMNQRDGGGISQSGLTWYNSIDIDDILYSITLDFYDASGTQPPLLEAQDMHTVWGNEFQNINLVGPGFWGSKGWEHKQADGKIYRCHTSGTSSTLPGTANGNELGSGAYVSVWDTPLRFSSVNPYSTGSITRGLITYSTVIDKFTSISWDTSDWVCGGTHSHISGVPSAVEYLGSTFFLNSSYQVTKAIGDHVYAGEHLTKPYHSSQVVNIRYLNTTSEYLTVGGVRYSPHGEGGLASGAYGVAVFQFTGGGTPNYDNLSGLMTETFHYPDWGDNGENYAQNVMDFDNRSSMLITDFFENEANNKVYAFCISDQSGTSSFRGRYVCELDTSSHPYTLNRTWLLTGETSASQMAIDLSRSQNSNYIQEFDY